MSTNKVQFVALDVETANPDLASICQIGVAKFYDGVVVEEWVSYVDPCDYFDEINMAVHGIDESTVRDAPRFSEIADQLLHFISDAIAVSHTHFDRTAIHQACQRSSIELPIVRWLDSARVTRRAWTDYARQGYGLASTCERLGYEFTHHDALEDAKAAGYVLTKAIEETGIDLEDWFERVRQPIDPTQSSSGSAIVRVGNSDGPLFGETVVFTGALTIVRSEAADLAASVGCEVAVGVNKKTTLLVVGDQDVRKLSGNVKSAKHRKAETLIEKGQSIRILRESDFRVLVALDASSE